MLLHNYASLVKFILRLHINKVMLEDKAGRKGNQSGREKRKYSSFRDLCVLGYKVGGRLAYV